MKIKYPFIFLVVQAKTKKKTFFLVPDFKMSLVLILYGVAGRAVLTFKLDNFAVFLNMILEASINYDEYSTIIGISLILICTLKCVGCLNFLLQWGQVNLV